MRVNNPPVKRQGETHPDTFLNQVFGSEGAHCSRPTDSTPLRCKKAYEGRVGIDSHEGNVRDPQLVGAEAVSSEAGSRGPRNGVGTTWKSQADEVLYGRDMDGSGSISQMMTSLEKAPAFSGAAGVSSLRAAMDVPEVRVDLNTQIDQTWAQPDKGEQPIAPREKIRRHVGNHPPECFARAGVAQWANESCRPGAPAGRDENWTPTTKMGKWFYSG